jgi:hypothetical protein
MVPTIITRLWYNKKMVLCRGSGSHHNTIHSLLRFRRHDMPSSANRNKIVVLQVGIARYFAIYYYYKYK